MKNLTNQKPSLSKRIKQYYELGLEAKRLSANAVGALEFTRTQEILSQYLPDPPAVILDIGGGPGAYACWLAYEGYAVHLIDPVPLHLEQAHAASQAQPGFPIQSITLADARSLGCPNEFADAVLLLGPLYHLTKRSDRLTALQEALRVLKPAGKLFAVGISRFASTLEGLIDGRFHDPEFCAIAQQDIRNGQHRNPSANASYFTTAFFHHPDELREEIVEAGFSLQNILAIEGAAVFLQNLEEQWRDPDQRQRVLEVVRWLEAEPSVIGITGHIMAIASKL